MIRKSVTVQLGNGLVTIHTYGEHDKTFVFHLTISQGVNVGRSLSIWLNKNEAMELVEALEEIIK